MSEKTVNLPKRYFKNIGLDDVITDCVRGSDGIERTVTMRGWFWRNLDWIDRNGELGSEALMVDIAERGRGDMDFDMALQGAIWTYIKTYDDMEKQRKNGDELPDVVIGNA